MAGFSRISQAVEQLSRSPLFADVSQGELSRVRPAPQLIHLAAGQTLMRQGDTDTNYYVLVKGRLSVFVRDANGAIIAQGHVYPGEGVGEMALLMSEPRSATVVARLDS